MIKGYRYKDQYEFIELLGAGGMGEVWRAKRIRLRDEVAIKVLKIGDEVNNKERLLAEAQKTSALNHPNICKVYDFIEDEDSCFMVMEKLEGQDLKQLIDFCKLSGIELDINFCLFVATSILKALDYAHNVNSSEIVKILHRDIKPANIFITKHGEIKLLDLGISKVDNGNSSQNKTLLFFSPAYSSPDLLTGDMYDGKSYSEANDLYSLGLVFYELFTLKRYNKQCLFLERECPRELVEVVKEWLEEEKEKRYQSASELIGNLNAIIDPRKNCNQMVVDELKKINREARSCDKTLIEAYSIPVAPIKKSSHLRYLILLGALVSSIAILAIFLFSLGKSTEPVAMIKKQVTIPIPHHEVPIASAPSAAVTKLAPIPPIGTLFEKRGVRRQQLFIHGIKGPISLGIKIGELEKGKQFICQDKMVCQYGYNDGSSMVKVRAHIKSGVVQLLEVYIFGDELTRDFMIRNRANLNALSFIPEEQHGGKISGENRMGSYIVQDNSAVLFFGAIDLSEFTSKPKEREIKKSISVLEAECKKRVGESCMDAGILLERQARDELSGPKFSKATQYFKKGCELKSGESCFFAGELVKRKEDSYKAAEFFDMGCMYDDPKSCEQLGLHYFEIFSMNYAYNKLKKACGLKLESACSKAQEAMAYVAGSMNQMSEKCKAKDGSACTALGDVFFQLGNLKSALDSWKVACKLDNGEGCSHLATEYYRKNEKKEAHKLSQYACELGHREGCRVAIAIKQELEEKN